jgi:hypothetical protein
VVADLLKRRWVEKRVRGSDLAYRMTIACFITKGQADARQ